MADYKILPHIADVKIQAFGKTKKELFSNALKGMIAVLRPEIQETDKRQRKIGVASADLNSLLADFLSETLYLIQTNKEVYDEVKFANFSDTKLEGELSGKSVARFGEDIKGVTYHDLKVKKNEDGIWEATVLFDI